MKNIKLVTRADDAGMNRTANKAIRSTVVQGVVRNISLLACGPEIAHAAHSFADLADKVDFGLHVCLTCEWANLRWGAVSGLPGAGSLLRSDGTFPASTEELEAMNPDPARMMAEVTAQYEKLRELGFTLRYIDTHMGVGRVNGLSAFLTRFARENRMVYSGDLMDRAVIKRLPGWDGPWEHPGTELADQLAMSPDGTYLVVGHPVFKSAEMETLALEGERAGDEEIPRNRQRRMFADIEIVDYCDNAGIHLKRYSELES